jgi:hypothetical protein
MRNTDIFFSFDLVTRSTSLNNPIYSDYQQFLFDTIADLFNKGMNHREIADWLNDQGYTTPRGKRFNNAHTHSILKKKSRSNERFNQTFPSEIKNCSLEHFDKTLVQN